MKRAIASFLCLTLLLGSPGVPQVFADDGLHAFEPALRGIEREVSAQKTAFFPVIPVAVAIAIGAFLTGCATVPLTGRKQLMLLPDSVMDDMGEQSWAQVKRDNRALPSGAEREMVQRVARRVIQAASRVDPALGGSWEVELFDAPRTVNAFAIPGRKIGFFTGILPYTKDEAGLAAVMGHEVGHVMARHGGERVSQVLAIQLGMTALDEAVLKREMRGNPQTRGLILGALGAGAMLGVVLPFSRNHESEADHIGILLAADAGYDPRAAVELWKRMPDSRTAEFMSTHPSHERRIRDLEGWMPEALARLRGAGAGTTR